MWFKGYLKRFYTQGWSLNEQCSSGSFEIDLKFEKGSMRVKGIGFGGVYYTLIILRNPDKGTTLATEG